MSDAFDTETTAVDHADDETREIDASAAPKGQDVYFRIRNKSTTASHTATITNFTLYGTVNE